MNNTDVWITSDSHYDHKNLVRGVSSWDDKSGCRDFDTLEEMNEALIDGINANVKENDHFYHIGDLAFGRGEDPIIEFRKRIRCRNVFVFIGNHDYRLRAHRSELRRLFLKVREKGTLRINDQDIVFNHFPELIWDKHHHGAWQLHGHCHNSLNTVPEGNVRTALDQIFHNRKVMDVGVDTHPEFRPYHFDEIKAIMDTRVIMPLDHHTGSRV